MVKLSVRSETAFFDHVSLPEESFNFKDPKSISLGEFQQMLVLTAK